MAEFNDNGEIVVVEESQSDAALMLRVLRKYYPQFPVRLLRDGAEALAYLCRQAPDTGAATPIPPRVIFLDVKLTKVTGLELLRRLKIQECTRFIPIVMFTNAREERDVEESYKLGANSYIVKPTDHEHFEEIINSLGRYWLHLNQLPR